MPDSTTLAWIFVLITLVPGGALLAAPRMSANARSGVLLACTGTWLAMAFVVVAALVAHYSFSVAG